MMIGKVIVFSGQQGTDEVLGDVGEGDGRAAHFTELGNQLGVAAVNAQRNLQLNAAQRFDGWKARAKIEVGPAETEHQATKSGEARPVKKTQKTHQDFQISK